MGDENNPRTQNREADRSGYQLETESGAFVGAGAREQHAENLQISTHSKTDPIQITGRGRVAILAGNVFVCNLDKRRELNRQRDRPRIDGDCDDREQDDYMKQPEGLKTECHAHEPRLLMRSCGSSFSVSFEHWRQLGIIYLLRFNPFILGWQKMRAYKLIMQPAAARFS